MKHLLDTHFLLWISKASPRLSPEARKIINDQENQLIFSVASIWEIAIKHGRKHADFVAEPRLVRSALLDAGYEELPILGTHASMVSNLPPIHRDPFDRLLIAQAIIEGITLLTADETISKYPGPIRRVL